MQVEEGWWEGVFNGKIGMFFFNFIKELLGELDEFGIFQDEQFFKLSKDVYYFEQKGKRLVGFVIVFLYIVF